MNRDLVYAALTGSAVPHMRGDEPSLVCPARGTVYLFPTCVGMNRVYLQVRALQEPVPHVRGDEPSYFSGAPSGCFCSPRAWG